MVIKGDTRSLDYSLYGFILEGIHNTRGSRVLEFRVTVIKI